MTKGIDRRDFLKLAGLGGVVFASHLSGYRRSHPHDRRPERAPQSARRVPRHRERAQGQERPLHAGRARRFPRLGQGIPGVLRQDATTRSTTRACISSCSTTSPIPAALVGDEQLQWLAADLKQLPQDAKIVVFTHRPLFDLYPQWDWATRDGAKAVELLHAAPQRHGVLRAHPPGAPSHDRAHCPSRGEFPDVSACPRRARSPSARRCRGTRPNLTRGWAVAVSKPR